MARSRSRYEDDDADYDRPSRRRRRDDDDEDHDPGRGGGGLPVGLIVGGAVCLGLLVVGGIVLALVMRKPGPQAEVASGDPPPAPEVRQVGPNPFPGRVGPPDAGAKPPPPKPQVGLGLPADSPGAKYLAFAGGDEGVVGMLGMAPVGGDIVTVAELKTGKQLGRVQLDVTDTGNGMAVAPGGRFAGVQGSGPFVGDPVVLFDLPAGKSFRFTPYSKKGAITNPGLVGFGFPAADRLLTVNETSGFDVWQLPAMQRVCGQPGRPPSSTPFVGTNAFTRCPTNWGLSADGKTVAIFDGSAFAFHDAGTAARTARTEAILPPGVRSMNFWGAAFNAAGTKFACLCSTYTPKTANALLVWEVSSGKRMSAATVPDGDFGAGIGWWGPNLLAVWQGGLSTAKVMAVETGTVVAEVKLVNTGLQQTIATTTRGDQLWYSFNGNGFAAGGAAPRLVSVPAPPALPGRLLTLTADGPRWN